MLRRAHQDLACRLCLADALTWKRLFTTESTEVTEDISEKAKHHSVPRSKPGCPSSLRDLRVLRGKLSPDSGLTQ